jgi:hypothetical protein
MIKRTPKTQKLYRCITRIRLYPNEHLEMRQGARVILKSGSGSTGWASSAGVSHGR